MHSEATCKEIGPSTQKPLALLSRIILASTAPNEWILDPFAGSSTTGIAANLVGRRYLGVEREPEFAAMGRARRLEIENIEKYLSYRGKIADIAKAEDSHNMFSLQESCVEELPFLA
ncbi:MAG: site-specific DNA-methyltransferase [Bacteroidaceae bacterium]|nr:site-specific DNA-methyltransferase [Bacteroidaceae bacterium]